MLSADKSTMEVWEKGPEGSLPLKSGQYLRESSRQTLSKSGFKGGPQGHANHRFCVDLHFQLFPIHSGSSSFTYISSQLHIQ